MKTYNEKIEVYMSKEKNIESGMLSQSLMTQMWGIHSAKVL